MRQVQQTGDELPYHAVTWCGGAQWPARLTPLLSHLGFRTVCRSATQIWKRVTVSLTGKSQAAEPFSLHGKPMPAVAAYFKDFLSKNVNTWKIRKEHISNPCLDHKPSFQNDSWANPAVFTPSSNLVWANACSSEGSMGLGTFKGDVCGPLHVRMGADAGVERRRHQPLCSTLLSFWKRE